MGLDLFPYLEDHACLFVHNGKIFKLKLNYADHPIDPKERADFHECLSREQAHNQLEEVLRAVLYILERDGCIVPIQTNNFTVYPTTSPWQLGKKIEFSVDGKVMLCYPDCLKFRVHLKEMSMASNENNNRSSASNKTLEQEQKGLSLLRENDHPSGCIQAKDKLPQAISLESDSSKIQSIPVLHTPCLGASNDAKNLVPPKKRSNKLSMFCKQSIDDSAQQLHALSAVNKSTKICLELNPTVRLADVMKVRNATVDTSVRRSRVDPSETSEVQSQSISTTYKLRPRQIEKPEVVASLLSSPDPILGKGLDCRHKDKQEKDTNTFCKNVLHWMASGKQRKGNTLYKKQEMGGSVIEPNAREVDNPEAYQSVRIESDMPEISKGHRGTEEQATEQNADAVIRVARVSIKKYRHQKTQSLKAKQTFDENGDGAVGNEGKESPQKKSLDREKNRPWRNFFCFEMQDSDMVEVHNNGSVITSPSYSSAGQGRKRRNKSPVQYDNKLDGRNNSEVKKQRQQILRSCSPKKKLYNSETGFGSFRNLNITEGYRSPQILKESSTTSQYYRQKLCEKQKIRTELKTVCAEGDSAKRNSQTRSSPRLGNKLNSNNIVTLYTNFIETASHLQPNLRSPKGTSGHELPTVETKQHTVKRSAHQTQNLSVRKSPKQSANGRMSEPIVSKKITRNSPNLRKRKSDLQNRYRASTSSTLSSPRPTRRHVGVRKSNIKRSASQVKTFNRARNRMLAAKDGVWLLDSGYEKLPKPRASQSHNALTKKMRERRARSTTPSQSYSDGFLSSSSERVLSSASSSSLKRPVLSLPPEPQGEAPQQEQPQRLRQPFKFWQFFSQFLRASPK
ncbi:hypothetical protein EGW08_021198 [Elysia chlorotica]|uniref:Uncharacterized protein n=1 Tax=Elysia chlorotica TaxID=188477 RepID=A0A3S1AZB2_ELYCH|nr:hypothetical protein EGW08_021198 [Elysia chlorotica]